MEEKNDKLVAPTEEEFLATLPPIQQQVVKTYAEAQGLTYSVALAKLMEIETRENIAERSHR